MFFHVALRSDPPRADLNVREQGDICGQISQLFPTDPPQADN